MEIPSIVFKLAALVLAIVCYVLLFFFHHAIFTPYEKLIVCSVFSGYLILYLVFSIGAIIGQDVDEDLNTVWALYGFAAYMGTGVLCIIMFTDRDDEESMFGIVGGAVAIVQAVVLGLDAWFLQQQKSE